MITIQLDLMKVDKKRLYPGKDGAMYLNAVLIETPNSDYSDYMIVESTTKEERDAGTKGTILGNAKIFKPVEKKEADFKAIDRTTESTKYQDDNDDLPF